jgi:hypothetical protein
MARFPNKEADVVALSEALITGLAGAGEPSNTVVVVL